MKILLVHNYYKSKSPSGENNVFDMEKQMLSNYGHNVKIYSKNNNDLINNKLEVFKAGIFNPWNINTFMEISKLIKNFKPDIVHVHNTFPQISPSVFYAAYKKSAVVLTLHNYRIFCASGTLQRNGKICIECIQNKSSLSSLKYGCYRSSKVYTLPLAANIYINNSLNTWNSRIDSIICLTNFQRELMIKSGIKSENLFCKPNYFPKNPIPVSIDQRPNEIVYAGRLSEDKGIRDLILAWNKWGEKAPILKIIGDGPLRDHIINSLANCNIKYLGKMNNQDTQLEIANSKLLIIPSIWYEGFPMVIQEAFAHGTPVAFSEIGSLAEIVINNKTGIAFKPNNSDDLLEKVQTLWKDSNKINNLSINAHDEFRNKYSEQINYIKLLDIYHDAHNKFLNRRYYG